MKRPDAKTLRIILKVGLFAFLAVAGLWLYGTILLLFGYMTAGVLGMFAAAATANALSMRIWEEGNLTGAGLPWNRASATNLLLGLGSGMASALVVLFIPVLEGASEMVKTPGQGDWRTAVFLMVALIFGAIGEEMMFHGYAFQVLMAALGPFATILPVSVLFGAAHSGNLNVTPLALVNTGLWGVLFGVAFWRSGDLWLPIGLHLGWNWMLPLFGANLSGFTMNVTGYAMQSRPGQEWWSGGAYGPEASPLTTAVLAVLFAWLLLKAPVRQQTPFLLRERWDEIAGPWEPVKE